MITIEQLKLISPRMAKNPNTCAGLFPGLVSALNFGDITSNLRISMFLGQVLHESGEFRYSQEIWGPTLQQLKYEPITNLSVRLGNTQKGDGFKYRGRGYIQLTGRSNYKVCGTDLGVDLVSDPDKVSDCDMACKTAVWFWTKHNLNSFADKKDLIGCTKVINGGTNGIDQREAFYKKALEVLGE